MVTFITNINKNKVCEKHSQIYLNIHMPIEIFDRKNQIFENRKKHTFKGQDMNIIYDFLLQLQI